MKFIDSIRLVVFNASVVIFCSCEKDISLSIPAREQQLVVEGHIEPGQPPYIILTRSSGYFAPQTPDLLTSLFVHDATVIVSNGIITDTLVEYCAAELDSVSLAAAAEFLGIPVDDIVSANFCLYTIDFIGLPSPAIIGETGKGYFLTIYSGNDTLNAYTTIPHPVLLDSVWFGAQKGYEPYGWAWARLSDPDTFGNSYRWFSKLLGEGGFTPSDGSAFTDKFFNGQSIDFFYEKPGSGFSNEDHDGMAGHMYKPGDTVIIKFTSIDYLHYEFVRSYETALYSNSNPFATPAPVKSNIQGGLGVWGGYGISYDTVFAK
ncbi:MAG: DUF4249 family protein [Bacteroidetes bacterium]|nr:DUF4249 family protein [Bacteroidota bacterium]